MQLRSCWTGFCQPHPLRDGTRVGPPPPHPPCSAPGKGLPQIDATSILMVVLLLDRGQLQQATSWQQSRQGGHGQSGGSSRAEWHFLYTSNSKTGCTPADC